MDNTINVIKKAMAKIQELQEKKENITIDDLDINQEDVFNEMLDDCFPKYPMGCIEFYPSDILKNCDPIAYKCDINDYFSMFENIENLAQYQDKIEQIDQEIEDIKTDIKSIIDNL